MNPFEILRVDPESDDECVRLAYLEAIKRNPPERDAERFQRIRDAYASIRTRDDRLRLRLFGSPAMGNLDEWINSLPSDLRRARLSAWLTVAKESKGANT